MTRSRLGDLIVMHGPYDVGALVPNAVMRFLESAELNALRDELTELRDIDTGCECLHAPVAQLSSTESAEQPPVGGSGRSEGSEAISEATSADVGVEDQRRFQVWSEALFGNNSVIRLGCGRCDWIVEIDGDDPFDLAELNQRADEHAEECR